MGNSGGDPSPDDVVGQILENNARGGIEVDFIKQIWNYSETESVIYTDKSDWFI